MSKFTPLSDLPQGVLAGYAPVPAEQGESGGHLMRFEAAELPPLYLKTGQGEVADEIASEFARLRWLAGRLPCPEVRAFTFRAGEAALLSTAVPGVTAHDALVADPAQGMALVMAVAAFLRTLHELPAHVCPFEAGFPLRLSAARQRVQAGLVDESDFGDAHMGWTAGDVLRAIETELPMSMDRVVTHGDFSLGNVLVYEGRVSGIIDVGRLGVADPYQDLAILHDSLAEFGQAAQAALWRGYGITDPDEARRLAHLRLDELF